MQNNSAKNLIYANFAVALVFFFVAILLGVYQVVERSGLFPNLINPAMYYASVSTHGVIMGFVLTTFFVMGFGYYCATTSLKMPVWGKTFAWAGFWISLIGVLLAAAPLLTGNASVMYTFYPPLKAHPAFYLGATLLVVGSWFWCIDMIMMTMRWKRENPGESVPLVMYGTTANAIMWLWTSMGVAAEVLFLLLPWSLGMVDTIDVGLARTLFSWTLHAIVYFWLFPAYIAMYTLLPKEAGGKLFSDELGRISFIMLMVISVPIGFHHLYMDPFLADGWKFLHMFGTFLVVLPTLFTGFTVLASLELAGRANGGSPIIGWFFAVPWRKPLVAAGMLGLLMLTAGGFGGLINASYAMNTMVHNTQWVTGHFHLIFAGTTVIMYFGILYYVWPRMTGRPLHSNGMALTQLWLWFFGMLLLTLPWHLLGLLGQPRRIAFSTAYDEKLTKAWEIPEIMMMLAGFVLLVSAILLVFNLWKSGSTTATDSSREQATDLGYADALYPPVRLPAILNGFAFWNILIFFYIAASYGYPIAQFFIIKTFGAPVWGV